MENAIFNTWKHHYNFNSGEEGESRAERRFSACRRKGVPFDAARKRRKELGLKGDAEVGGNLSRRMDLPEGGRGRGN